MNKLIFSASLLFLVSMLNGCSTTNKDVPAAGNVGTDSGAASKPVAPAAAASSAISHETSSEGISASRAVASGTSSADLLNNPNSILAKRSVYYPFDVSVVQAEDKAIVEAHAKFLSEHPNQKVRLEGNCDERGSDEYNLALGQRRADGVKQLLLVGGVKDIQVSTVSYGEEKPKTTGHDEASWSQNRRTDLNYSAN
jgi:peptidoglycan-associated lipoprotein